MGRIDNASKNIKYGYLGTILTLIFKFVSRTVFIYTISVTYLGINGLYTNVLSVLSFAELGIGTAMNYSLYKPVANNDIEKIKSLMKLYKQAYYWVALVVFITGLSIIPFLKYIIKDTGNIKPYDLNVYYLIFLFNTVSTYFISYKYSLVNADQKSYLQTNIKTIVMLITTVLQIIVLVIFKSFLFFLVVEAIIELIQKLFVSKYLNSRYPYLLDKDIKILTKEEIKPIKNNIKALIYHKIGEMSVHQTDNILISSFINITTVGLISNYVLIITSVTSLFNIIFNSLISGFGNLIVTESIEKQFFLFKVYRFIGFWLYGFASIAFIVLLGPFIELWGGKEMVIVNSALYLIIIDYYVKGHRIVVNNFKTAAGIFDADKYISLIQAVVNLVVSIFMVRKIGLPGIYVGTVMQGLISTFTRPVIIYKKVFKISSKGYYKDSVRYLSILLLTLIILEIIKINVLGIISLKNFIIMAFSVLIIPNIFFMCMLKNREEYKYLLHLFKMKGMQKEAKEKNDGK